MAWTSLLARTTFPLRRYTGQQNLIPHAVEQGSAELTRLEQECHSLPGNSGNGARSFGS
jgi:hypothetical protein